MSDILKKEDYEEPACLLNMHPEIKRIPVSRVIEKLDAFLNRNDYPAAEKHLVYWLAEAEAGKDIRGELTVLNELIGLYRKTGQKEAGLKAITRTLALLNTMGMEGTVSYATTLINAATAYKAFGRAADALPLYRQARAIYEARLEAGDARLAGCYNNMALALTELKAYREAEALFLQALELMLQQEHGEPEAAITCLNLADLIDVEVGSVAGEEAIAAYLRRAEDLLNTESIPQNGYYAFVCEKCAPAFGYYGWFYTENELRKRAKAIYERA